MKSEKMDEELRESSVIMDVYIGIGEMASIGGAKYKYVWNKKA